MALLAMLQLLFWFICDYEWCECSDGSMARRKVSMRPSFKRSLLID
jgi:hypothetical protein